MLKLFLKYILLFGLLAFFGQCDETTTSASVEKSSLYESVNLPPLSEGCVYHFYCARKWKAPETPHPCLQFCLNYIMCGNEKTPYRKGMYCIDLKRDKVIAQHSNETAQDKVDAGKVAMIDFPCQPGYMPDSRGRCREVW